MDYYLLLIGAMNPNHQHNDNLPQCVEQLEQQQVRQQQVGQQQIRQQEIGQQQIGQQQLEQQKIGQEQLGQQKDQMQIPSMKKPISPYMIFIRRWKENHPNEKMELSLMGQIWNELSGQQKKIYIDQFRNQKIKYDEYLLNNEIHELKVNKSVIPNYLFPLARVKSIMKQDHSYQPKIQAMIATNKATEFFAEYLLEQIRKVTQGNARITSNHLYDVIRAKSNVLGFMDCLIHHPTNQQPSQHNPKKQKTTTNKPIQKISSGQKRITDMFHEG